MIQLGFLLAMLAAPAGPTTQTAILVADAEGVPARLHCAGTEPFWSVTIEGGEAVFETPENQGPSAPRLALEDTLTAQNRLGLWAFRMKSQEGQESVAVVRAAACSDGMSDREYPYAVAFLHGEGELLDGCCE